MSTSEEILRQEIEELEVQLRARRAALAELESSHRERLPLERTRFSPPMRPWKAAAIYLKEIGRPLAKLEIMKALEYGGALQGKKRGHANLRISLEKSVATGSLTEQNGLIGLPEWPSEAFKNQNWREN